MWMQGARRQRPLLKGVPRQWRSMYTAGGASRNVDSAYKDFWYLFSDTYPPALPYPSERGDSRWRSVGCLLWMLCVDASCTAAASPFERGATTVAGYVYRWRSQQECGFRLYGLLVFVFGYIPPRLRRTPLKEGTRGGGASVSCYGCCVWMQAARRQRPLLIGVPREWRGMYTAGGASRNEDSAYNDFWYLFLDTYPPASPYPSKRGDSRWRCVGR